MARKIETTRREDVQPAIPCAHEGCQEYAVVKLLMPTGWAKLCMPHYELHFAKQGDKATAAAGLDRWSEESRDAWRKRVFAHWKELSRKAPMNRGRFDNEEAA
jgi:hypothetical protein